MGCVLLVLVATLAHAAHPCALASAGGDGFGRDAANAISSPCSLCLTPAAAVTAVAGVTAAVTAAPLALLPAAPVTGSSVFFVLYVRPPPAG